MSTRRVTATITTPVGGPIEGLHLDFAPLAGGEPVSVLTDATGVFVADLEPGVAYGVGLMGSVQVDGVQQRAVTVLRVMVPEGESEGDLQLTDVATELLSSDWPALLARLEAVEAASTDLAARVAALEVVP